MRHGSKIKEAQRHEEFLDQQNRAHLAEKQHLAEITSRHGRERYAEELAIIKAESEIDEARILAEDDNQLLGDVVEENHSLVCDRVAIGPEEKVNDFVNSLTGTGDLPELSEASRPILIRSRDDQSAHANNMYPELPYGPVALCCLSPQTASFNPAIPSAALQTACLPQNDIVQLAAYRDLLIVDGGQSFSGDLLQYYLLMERLNFGVLRIFGKSDSEVGLQIAMKSCSGDALAAIRGCTAVSDKAIALKQAFDILSRL